MQPKTQKVRILYFSPYSSAVIMAVVGFVIALIANIFSLLAYALSILVSGFQNQLDDSVSFPHSLSSLVTIPIQFSISAALTAFVYNFVVSKLKLGISIEIQKDEIYGGKTEN